MNIILVDNSDSIIGNKERSRIDAQKDIYRVSALWLTNADGQVLLGKRSVRKQHSPGCWGPAVAGTNEEGETYESNMYKEAEEEIGLTGQRFLLGPKIRYTSPNNFFCQWYLAINDRPADSFTIQQDEVEQLAWHDIEKLKQDVTAYPQNYVPSLPKLIETLQL